MSFFFVALFTDEFSIFPPGEAIGKSIVETINASSNEQRYSVDVFQDL